MRQQSMQRNGYFIPSDRLQLRHSFSSSITGITHQTVRAANYFVTVVAGSGDWRVFTRTSPMLLRRMNSA